jgi:transcriptional regulator with XRE-family HTH domain
LICLSLCAIIFKKGGCKLSVNENIKFWRLNCGLTQAKLANMVGISQNYLSQIERGTRTVSLDLLDKIADAFDTHPTMLLAEFRPTASGESSKEYGPAISWIREKRGLSIKDFSKAIGETPETVMMWEKDGGLISANKLDVIASVLDVSLDYIHGWGESDGFDKSGTLKTLRPILPPSKTDPSISLLVYWADVVDKARAVAERRNEREIAEVESMLRKALEAVEIVGAELDKSKQLSLPSDVGDSAETEKLQGA